MTKELDASDLKNRTSLVCRERQFSIRSLSVCVVLFSAGCAVVAWLIREPLYPVIEILSPVVSPSGEHIAFIAVRGNKRFSAWAETGDVEMFERFSDSLDVRLSIITVSDGRVTNTGAEIDVASAPTWAVDSTHIGFVSGHADTHIGTRFMGLDSFYIATNAVKQIAPPESWSPQFSVSGLYLGYVRRNARNALIVENICSGESQRVQTGVSAYHWCWGHNTAELFYIRDKSYVCRFDLLTSSERILFVAPPSEGKYPTHVLASPDGTHMGFRLDGYFYTVELPIASPVRRFKCAGAVVGFDWNVAGICYVDSADGHTRVMICNPETGECSLVVTGPFDYPRWLDRSQILVRKGRTELWSYDVASGKGALRYKPGK